MSMALGDNRVGLQPPAWISRWPHLAFCSNCGAVWNRDAHFVRGYYQAQVTSADPRFLKTGDCVRGECPICRAKEEGA